MGRILLVLGVWLGGLAYAERLSKPDPIIEDLRLRALAYFVDNAHPQTGLIRDRAPNLPSARQAPRHELGSIAATGMGLAVLAHAAKTGRLPAADVYRQIEKTLRFVAVMPHYKGWLYHFHHRDTGARWGYSEASTIDTALFLAGALYAGQIFPATPVAQLADTLYARADFNDMLTDGGRAPARKTISHGWTPELGYLLYQWDTYAEHLLLVLLGIGKAVEPLSIAAWDGFARNPQMPIFSPRSLYGLDLPLFVHQYSHLFVDFRDRKDGFTNYFDNSVAVTRESRLVTLANKTRASYLAGFWGLSAGDTPAGGYEAYSLTKEDGTVCLGCAGASAMFDPTIQDDLRGWIAAPNHTQYWGKYGFSDGVNLDLSWYDEDAIGITVAGLYLGLANVPGEISVWADFMRIPAIARAMNQVLPKIP